MPMSKNATDGPPPLAPTELADAARTEARFGLDFLRRHGARLALVFAGVLLPLWGFGELADEASSFKIMDTALDAGINFFDTADVYDGPQSPDMAKGFGTSEEIIGRWLAQAPSRRDRIVLATKVYQPMETGPNDKYLSAYHVRRACEARPSKTA